MLITKANHLDKLLEDLKNINQERKQMTIMILLVMDMKKHKIIKLIIR